MKLTYIKNHYLRRFFDLNLFVQQRFEFISERIFTRFSQWFIFLKNLEERKHMKLCLSTSTQIFFICLYCGFLYVVRKYLGYIFLFSFRKWQRKLITTVTVNRIFRGKSLISSFKLVWGCFWKIRAADAILSTAFHFVFFFFFLIQIYTYIVTFQD